MVVTAQLALGGQGNEAQVAVVVAIVGGGGGRDVGVHSGKRLLSALNAPRDDADLSECVQR